MDIKSTAADMLALLHQPAFCVENQIIISVNEAAARLDLAAGTSVCDLLATGKEEYAQFSDGCLYLTLKLSDCHFSASIQKVGQLDVFTLEDEEAAAQLQSMALAAKELRRPLSNLVTVSDSLVPTLGSDGTPELQEQLAQLQRGLYQLQRLVGNMSDAGRYLNKTPDLRETRNVCAILSEFFEKLEAAAESLGIRFQYTLPGRAIYCPVDEALLERAVYNLASNAFKFTPKGGSIGCKVSQQGNFLHIRFTDSGCGIAAGILSQLHTRYLRPPAIEDSRQGIGLGMVMVRAAAAAHGGTVLVETPETGTRITLTLSLTVTETVLRSPIHKVDYTGERSHLLLELSDCLSADSYLS